MRSQNESDLAIYCDLLKGRIPYNSKVRLCSHVLQSSINDLKHHKAMLEAMGLGTDAKNNIHIGGAYGDKVTSSQRFVERVDALELSLRERMTLENDDKTFNAVETLEACKRTGLPMVLDIHHQWVNNEGEKPWELWPGILDTWKGELAQTGWCWMGLR